MFAISSTGSYRPEPIGATRAIVAAPPSASVSRLRDGAVADSPSRLTLGARDEGGAIYSDPRAKPSAARIWLSPVGVDDAVSAIMARNRGMNSYSLGDQWRGLGGALLTRFASTGENYAQTMVDDQTTDAARGLEALSPEEQAQHAASIAAKQAVMLANVSQYAPSASLKIQTRSGQSVELKISVNPGFDGVIGMQVELKASGAMTASERTAIAQLASGLDRALEGLGRDDAVALDLSGLTNYDRDAIGSIDLTVNNTQSHQVLRTFSLHLGDDQQSIALKGSDGDMNLSVDKAAGPGNAPAPQRNAALQSTLDRMVAAGQRGHANAELVKQMVPAFKQLQAAAPTADAPATSQLSGLADFEASFSGEARRSNRFGSTKEVSQAQYQLSQKTTTQDAGTGGRSVAQTVSERLSADIRQASGPDAMLDVRNGNHSTIGVHDSRTVTTLIDSAADHTTRVLRKTDEQQLKTLVDLESHRVTRREPWPLQRSLLERL